MPNNEVIDVDHGHSFADPTVNSWNYDNGDDNPARARHSFNEEDDKTAHMHSSDSTACSNVLGVFGLSMYTTEDTLQELYEAYGKVLSVKLIYDRDSKRSRGFGFVTFEDQECAKKAMSSTNEMDLDGKPIRVDYSRTSGPHDPTPGRYMGKPTSRRSSYPPRDSRYGGSREYPRNYYDDRAYSRRDDSRSTHHRRDNDRYYERPSYRSEYSHSRDEYPREYRRDDVYPDRPRRNYYESGRPYTSNDDLRQSSYGEYSRQSRSGSSRIDRSLSP